MGFLNKMKSKYSSWQEEKEQKEYLRLQTESKLADMYNKRTKEKKEMKSKIDKMKKDKFDNSFVGKVFSGLNEMAVAPKKKKCKKKLNLKKARRQYNDEDDLFGGEDFFSR